MKYGVRFRAAGSCMTHTRFFGSLEAADAWARRETAEAERDGARAVVFNSVGPESALRSYVSANCEVQNA